jgi:asparagine synthase (glutamine-hydrolysing)
MCGIAGYFLARSIEKSSENIDLMLPPIRSRGPDDEGVCLLKRGTGDVKFYRTENTAPSIATNLPIIADDCSIINHDLALIHTRYSIIDLSDAAHQPFVSSDRSIAGIFNGEIYNYIELKEELSSFGVKFRTASDTEVLIEGYRVWREKLWTKMNGFWAVALYDFNKDEIILSRDRIGVAPLYYREMQNGFYFASTIKSLIDLDPSSVSLNQDTLLGFAQTGIKDHAGTTFYNEIKSLPSSETVIFRPHKHSIIDAVSDKYWDFPSSRLSTKDLSFSEAVNRFRETFFSAVKLRLRADVQLAFELSGGLDSSSIVAAAANLTDKKIRTYTAKVKDADEEPFARAILDYYPVDYRVIENFERGFKDNYDQFSHIMEEPFDNPNLYTHHRMLQKMKSDGVSVVLTGAGGDEVLAGYEASFWPSAYTEMRHNGHYWQAELYEFCRRFMTIREALRTISHYLFDLPKFFKNSIVASHIDKPGGYPTAALELKDQYRELSFHERTRFHFSVALVPFYMRSSDHFTMGVPVEHRFPLLDYRLVELGLQMPVSYLFKNGWTKYLLRKAMEPYLPDKIIWRRKKMGFKFPFYEYFREYRDSFSPLISYLKEIDFPTQEFGDYDQLLKQDAVVLWRLLSTAIWVKNQVRYLYQS